MKLVKCESVYAPVTVICYDCSRRITTNDAYADLDGESFKAYYCKICKIKREVNNHE